MNRRLAFARLLVALLALVGARSAFAQADSRPVLYQLRAESQYVEGCFPPCLCPIYFQDNVQGTFKLTFVNNDTLFDNYTVSEVLWVFRRGGTEYLVRGGGRYRVGGEFALTHQLTLDLTINGDAFRFDSGQVVGGFEFPEINIDIAVNGFFCYDRAFEVRASPVRPGAISRYCLSPVSSYEVGCQPPCLCPISLQGLRGGFGLLPLGDRQDTIVNFGVTGARFEIFNLFPSPSDPPPPPIVATGFGVYQLDAATGQQRMRLELKFSDTGDVLWFDSGWVGSAVDFPRISIALAINNFFCFDRVLNINAGPCRQRLSLEPPTMGRPSDPAQISQ